MIFNWRILRPSFSASGGQLKLATVNPTSFWNKGVMSLARKKARFRIYLPWGALLAFMILLLTHFYQDIGNFDIDSIDRVWDLFRSKLLDRADHWLTAQWKWKPTDSDVVNITVGIVHVMLIAAIILPCAFLTWFAYAFGYVAPLCIGTTAGYVAAYIMDSVSRTHVPYQAFMLNGSRIATYVSHTLIAGLTLYLIQPANIRLGSLKPIKIAIAIIYDAITGGKGVNAMNRNPPVVIPQVFDENQIDAGLLRYRADKRLLDVFISGLVERYKDEAQIKVIRKKLERLNLGKRYLDTLYQARQAYNRIVTFDEVDGLERQKRELEKKKLEAESARIDLEEEVKRKELELKLAQLKAQKSELMRKGKEKKPEEKKDEIREAVQKVRDRFFSIEKVKQEIRQMYPEEEAESMIDEFERMLVEERIIGK